MVQTQRVLAWDRPGRKIRVVLMKLAAFLSILGLALDFFGAACLAYNVLFGKESQRQASARRKRLLAASERHERHDLIVRKLSQTSGSLEERLQLLQQEVPMLNALVTETLQELRRLAEQEQRARVAVVMGMVLLVVGFACQGIGAIISAVTSGILPLGL